jgi:hypothetical protein
MASQSSRSPRDARESTNDPEAFVIGKVQDTGGPVSPRKDPVNDPAFEKAEKTPPYKNKYF